MSKQFSNSKHPSNGLHRRRTCQLLGKIGQGRWIWLFIFNQQLRWNAWMWIVAINLRSFNQRWSVQILPHHVCRRIVRWSRPSDQKSTSKISPRVHRSPSRAFNLSRYNSSNQRLRLKHFKVNRRPIRFCCVPLLLSEDRWSQFNTRIERSRLHHVAYDKKNKNIGIIWKK